MSDSVKKGITCTNDATALMEKFSKLHEEFWLTNDAESSTKVLNKWFTDDVCVLVNEQKYIGINSVVTTWAGAITYVTKFKIKPSLRQWHKNGMSFTESVYCTTADGQELQFSFDNSVVYDFERDLFSMSNWSTCEVWTNKFHAGLGAFFSKK